MTCGGRVRGAPVCAGPGAGLCDLHRLCPAAALRPGPGPQHGRQDVGLSVRPPLQVLPVPEVEPRQPSTSHKLTPGAQHLSLWLCSARSADRGGGLASFSVLPGAAGISVCPEPSRHHRQRHTCLCVNVCEHVCAGVYAGCEHTCGCTHAHGCHGGGVSCTPVNTCVRSGAFMCGVRHAHCASRCVRLCGDEHTYMQAGGHPYGCACGTWVFPCDQVSACVPMHMNWHMLCMCVCPKQMRVFTCVTAVMWACTHMSA